MACELGKLVLNIMLTLTGELSLLNKIWIHKVYETALIPIVQFVLIIEMLIILLISGHTVIIRTKDVVT